MRVITINTSGSFSDEETTARLFHSWRLGVLDGVHRRTIQLDLGLEIHVPVDQKAYVENTLGCDLALALAEPARRRDMRPPLNGAIVVTARDRQSLCEGQIALIHRELEALLVPGALTESVTLQNHPSV